MSQGLHSVAFAVLATLTLASVGQARPRLSFRSQPQGVFLVFADTLSLPERDALHRKLGTRVAFRDARAGIDAVLPQEGPTDDSRALGSLCRRYRLERNVTRCELNYPLFATEPPHASEGWFGVGRAEKPRENLSACQNLRPSRTVPASLRREGLDPFWNREYTGLDLAEEALKEFEKKNGRLPSLALAYLEVGKDPAHATGVSRLLKDFSGRETLDPPILDRNEAQLAAALRNLRKNPPTVVNLSQTVGSSDAVYEEFEKLSEKTLAVLSVGNSYPYAPGKNETRVSAITVASATPQGILSSFVQDGHRSHGLPLVDILVPSDRWLVYRKADGEYDNFGWNSGAAPQVAGLLARVAAVLPGLNLEEAKYLLKKTSIPTYAGVGLLNAYKLVRVALRLRERGGADGWKQTLRTDRTILDFNDEGEKRGAEAASALESLRHRLGGKENLASLCKALEEAQRLARQGFLVVQNMRNVSSVDGKIHDKVKRAAAVADKILPSLASLYELEGLTEHRQFYLNQDADRLLLNLKDLVDHDHGEDENLGPDFDSRASVRQAMRFGPRGAAIFQHALAKGSPWLQEWAVYAGADEAENSEAFLRKALPLLSARDDDPALGAFALVTLGLPEGKGLSFLEGYLADENGLARQRALSVIYLRARHLKARYASADAEIDHLRRSLEPGGAAASSPALKAQVEQWLKTF